MEAIRGHRLEALKGYRAGRRSVRIDDRRRICFSWREGNAHDVEIAEYHLKHVFNLAERWGSCRGAKPVRMAARAGLEDGNRPKFRHLFATRLDKNGGGIVTVKELLGHSGVKVTLRCEYTNRARKW